MTLSRNSGGKPQNVEDRIGCGALRLAPDPVLDPGKAVGRLVDVVAVDIGNRLEQLIDTVIAEAGRSGSRRMGTASRHQGDRSRSVVLSHPIAFLRGVATSAEPRGSALTQMRPLAA